MKFNEYITFYKQNYTFPHALLVECHGCIDYELLINNYLKSLVCDEKLFCDQCKWCQKINLHSYIHLVVIDCTSQQLQKDDVKKIQSTFNLSSGEDKDVKLYAIINIENANKVSSNALLKFMEEPPKGTFALFFCKNENSVLETIRSRCQKIRVTNENKMDDELINYCFDSKNQYEDFIEFFNLQEETNFIQNFIKKVDIIEQIKFINKIKQMENKHIAIYLNIIAFYLNIDKKVAIKDLKKYLHLNLNKILLANKVISILEN